MRIQIPLLPQAPLRLKGAQAESGKWGGPYGCGLEAWVGLSSPPCWYHTQSPNSVLPIFGIPVPILAAQDFSGLTNFESSFPASHGVWGTIGLGKTGLWASLGFGNLRRQSGVSPQPHYPAPFQVAHLL